MKNISLPIVLDTQIPTPESIEKAIKLGHDSKVSGLKSIIQNTEFIDMLNLHGKNIDVLIAGFNKGYRS